MSDLNIENSDAFIDKLHEIVDTGNSNLEFTITEWVPYFTYEHNSTRYYIYKDGSNSADSVAIDSTEWNGRSINGSPVVLDGTKLKFEATLAAEDADVGSENLWPSDLGGSSLSPNTLRGVNGHGVVVKTSTNEYYDLGLIDMDSTNPANKYDANDDLSFTCTIELTHVMGGNQAITEQFVKMLCGDAITFTTLHPKYFYLKAIAESQSSSENVLYTIAANEVEEEYDGTYKAKVVFPIKVDYDPDDGTTLQHVDRVADSNYTIDDTPTQLHVFTGTVVGDNPLETISFNFSENFKSEWATSIAQGSTNTLIVTYNAKNRD